MRNRSYGWYARDLELRRKRRAERPHCAVKGCETTGDRKYAGEWRTYWLCSRHWRLYQKHAEILEHIRIAAIYSHLKNGL